MFFHRLIVAAGLCLIVAGVAKAAVTNVYWRTDLNQGTSIIAYGQGATEQAAWEDCFRLQVITRAMTAAETRKIAVAAVTSPVVRWCKNPMRFATITPDPAGTVTLSWTPPTQNTDGSALTDLAGYRISYGATPDALTSTVRVTNPAITSYVLGNLTPGAYYFAVRTYTAGGKESRLSNIITKAVL